jgi:hypothetical protein
MFVFSARLDWEARLLLEKSYLECGGFVGECARATQEHISVNDERKIGALHGVHGVLEHLTLLSTKRVERRLKEAAYDTEIQIFRSQALSG